MPSYKHKSSRRRTAQAETARTHQRKIRRQAETTGDPYLDTAQAAFADAASCLSAQEVGAQRALLVRQRKKAQALPHEG